MASKQLMQSAVQSSSLLSNFAANPTCAWMRQGAMGGMLHFSTRAAAPAFPAAVPSAARTTPVGVPALPVRPKYFTSASTKPLPAIPTAASPLLEAAPKANYSAAAAEAADGGEHYVAQMKWLHWLMASGIITCMLLIQAARASQGEQKGYYMMLHKSIGLSLLALISYRSVLRFTTKIPAHLPGAAWEHWAAWGSHTALYGFMWFMPLSGVVMGYYGGKGLPFFGYTIPGRKEPIGAYAKWAFKTHKWAGQVFQYFVPVHVGAAFYHRFKGQWIFERVNPFAVPRLA